VLELIVATAVLLEDQLPPVTEEVRVVVPFAQIFVVPEIVPALSAGFTVIVNVCAADKSTPPSSVPPLFRSSRIGKVSVVVYCWLIIE
jgi:hypothetical protein